MPQRLLVPLFQRPYVWTRENQWTMLWDDIRRHANLRHSGIRSSPLRQSGPRRNRRLAAQRALQSEDLLKAWRARDSLAAG